FNIPSSTINDTIKRYKETGSAIPEKHSECEKTLTQRDTCVLQCIICKDGSTNDFQISQYCRFWS
ncbi:20065_t:CDS:1, partial [Rhizophagus irregularis]